MHGVPGHAGPAASGCCTRRASSSSTLVKAAARRRATSCASTSPRVDYLAHPASRPLPDGVDARALRGRRHPDLAPPSASASAPAGAGARGRPDRARRCSTLHPGTEAMEREVVRHVRHRASTATPTSPASSCPRTGTATRCARTTTRPHPRAVQGRSGRPVTTTSRRMTTTEHLHPTEDPAPAPPRARQEPGQRRRRRRPSSGCASRAPCCACPRPTRPTIEPVEAVRRRDHDHQHGAAAPQHPRRAAPHARARGRDRAAHQADHRLPAHRHGEDGRGAHLPPGLHQRHPHGLRRRRCSTSWRSRSTVEKLLGIEVPDAGRRGSACS